MIAVKCLHCGHDFTAPKSRRRKFCSDKCFAESLRKNVMATCRGCKCKYEVSYKRTYKHRHGQQPKFCSLPCYFKHKTVTKSQRTRIRKATKLAMNVPEIRDRYLKAARSPEKRRKAREFRLQSIKQSANNQWVQYNVYACDFFNHLNMFMEWNGVHAQSGGEFSVVGYSLDYYEPTENLVIEWDEPHHRYRKRKDRQREIDIITALQCEFYRIDQTTLEFRQVTL